MHKLLYYYYYVCVDFEPCFKVYNLVSIRPKSMKLGQMTNLNVIFHMVGSVYRLVTIRNSPQFPVEFRNGLLSMFFRRSYLFIFIDKPSRKVLHNLSLLQLCQPQQYQIYGQVINRVTKNADFDCCTREPSVVCLTSVETTYSPPFEPKCCTPCNLIRLFTVK